jgi:4-amino-4-deoxy-L-arabinose transferase-like glycosyltransferase
VQRGPITYQIDLESRPANRGWLPAIRQAAPLVITVIAGLFCYGLFVRRGVWLSVVGYSVSPAERVLQGEVPYRDFLYNYTPGTLWLNALLMKVFTPSLMTVNLGVLAFKLATLVALFQIAKNLFGAWAALVPVGLTLTWLGHKYIFGVVPTQYSLFFVLVALSLMLSYNRSGSARWLWACGLMIGIVLIFKYNVGILLLGAGTAGVALRELVAADADASFSRRLVLAVRRSASLWGGFGLAIAALIGYMAYHGALGAMVNHFLSHAAEYSGARAVSLPHPKQLAPVTAGLLVSGIFGWFVLRWAPRFLGLLAAIVLLSGCTALVIPGRAYLLKVSAAAAVAYFPLALFAAVAALVAWKLYREPNDEGKRRLWWERYGALIIVALFTLGAYMEMYPRADNYHLVRVLPAVFLLFILFLSVTLPQIADYFQRYHEAPIRIAILCCSVPLVLLAVAGVQNTWRPHFDARFNFRDSRPLSIERGKGMLVNSRQAEFIEGMTREIEDRSGPDDYIFSFAQRGSGFYFLAGRLNPTRFVWWRSVGIDSEDREAALGMIKEKRARLILLQNSLSNPRVREAVTSNYHQVAMVTDIAIFERNP